MKKKNRIILIIIFILVFTFSISKYKNYLDIKREFNKTSKELLNTLVYLDDFKKLEKAFNEYNTILDEIKKTYDINKYNETKEEIEELPSSTFKDTLTERLYKIESLLQEYEKKKKLMDSNPDKSTGITIDKDNVKAIETISGNITAFTPYCGGGCNGYTASGIFIGNNIFYNDKEYGIVRIVAGDSSYPFGTIVRIKNLNYFDDDVYAIVLDRGSAIGKNKWALFDLLFYSENNANNFGVEKAISCDILRIGY